MPSTSNRTIEPLVSVFSSAEIRVAILPVGPVPEELLEVYSEQIRNFHHVSLSATRSFYREPNQKTPFQHIDWKDGHMRFRFLNAEEARRKTRILDLHPSRKVAAVIGVVHCPMAPNIEQAYAQFQDISSQYPEAYVHRCFVFEPSEDHIRQESQHLKNLVMFPPGQSHLEQHLEVWMHDLAALVLTELERWMLTSGPSVIKPGGYADSSEFTGQSAVIEEVTKRLVAMSDEEAKENRRWGRLMKTKGDLCLMSGSPEDAREMYRSCIELAKASNDYVWHASALEGLAHARMLSALNAAHVHMRLASAGTGVLPSPGGPRPRAAGGGVQEGMDGEHVWALMKQQGVEEEVRALFVEARSWYRKKGGVLPMQIELSLKLARLLSGLNGCGCRREVMDLIGGILEHVPSLHLLEDRLVAMGEAAQVAGLVGCGRKRQLLLWHAAELSRLFDKSELLRLSTTALQPPDDPRMLLASSGWKSDITHWSLLRASYLKHHPEAANWTSIQAANLEAALSAAKHAGSPNEAWAATAALLREHYTTLSPATQAGLLDSLSQAAAALPSSAKTRHGRGPSPLAMLKAVLPPPPSLQPKHIEGLGSQEPKTDDQKCPFIFNPYADKRPGDRNRENGEVEGPAVEWVCGEEGRVDLYLINPLAVALKVDEVSIHMLYTPNANTSQPGGKPGTESSSPAPSTSPTQAGGGDTHSVEVDLKQDPRQLAASAAASATLAQRGPQALSDLPHHQPPAPKPRQQAMAEYWLPRPVGLTLAPNGKPTRVQLCGTPLLEGQYTLVGVRFSAGGATWQEPLGEHKSKVSAAFGHTRRLRGSEPSPALTPSLEKAQTVTVLPCLPLVRATLTCGECRESTPPASSSHHQPIIQAVTPLEAELDSRRGGPTTVSGQPTVVTVWEGQQATWKLTLTNIGKVAMHGLYLSVADAKGVQLQKLPPGSRLPPAFVGATLHILDDGSEGGALSLGLPLAPGGSLEVPVALNVGRAPMPENFEDIILQVNVTYTTKDERVKGGDASKESGAPGSGKSPTTVMGRKMVLPVQLLVQRTIQVAGLHFLEYTVPKNQLPSIERASDLDPAKAKLAQSKAHGSKSKSEDVRKRLELTATNGTSDSSILFPPAPPGPPSHEGSSSTLKAGWGSSGATTTTATPVQMVMDCVMEVVINNVSDRYFRVWLEPQGGASGSGGGGIAPSKSLSLPQGSADLAVQRVAGAGASPLTVTGGVAMDGLCLGGGEDLPEEVLQPADGTSLRCLLHPTLGPPAPPSVVSQPAEGGRRGAGRSPLPGGGAKQGEGEEKLAIAAKTLASSWLVCWKMITGDETGSWGSPEAVPCGKIQLIEKEIEKVLTQEAVAVLHPSPIRFSFAAPSGGGAQGKPLAQDITMRVLQMGVCPPSSVGELWGLQVEAGSFLELEVLASSTNSTPQPVIFSIAATPVVAVDECNLLIPSPTIHSSPSLPHALASDFGVVLTGSVEAVHCTVSIGVDYVHRLAAMFMEPGLYQMSVCEVAAVHGADGGGKSGAETTHRTMADASSERLNILVV